ncbi:uncharacterized protein [Notamacropus eugenii]|uniref:uncharacterized protein n=1 Tax=Notamacropus eugenii TaxID=9315 RepID=UPI003B67759B
MANKELAEQQWQRAGGGRQRQHRPRPPRAGGACHRQRAASLGAEPRTGARCFSYPVQAGSGISLDIPRERRRRSLGQRTEGRRQSEIRWKRASLTAQGGTSESQGGTHQRLPCLPQGALGKLRLQRAPESRIRHRQLGDLTPSFWDPAARYRQAPVGRLEQPFRLALWLPGRVIAPRSPRYQPFDDNRCFESFRGRSVSDPPHLLLSASWQGPGKAAPLLKVTKKNPGTGGTWEWAQKGHGSHLRLFFVPNPDQYQSVPNVEPQAPKSLQHCPGQFHLTVPAVGPPHARFKSEKSRSQVPTPRGELEADYTGSAGGGRLALLKKPGHPGGSGGVGHPRRGAGAERRGAARSQPSPVRSRVLGSRSCDRGEGGETGNGVGGVEGRTDGRTDGRKESLVRNRLAARSHRAPLGAQAHHPHPGPRSPRPARQGSVPAPSRPPLPGAPPRPQDPPGGAAAASPAGGGGAAGPGHAGLAGARGGALDPAPAAPPAAASRTRGGGAGAPAGATAAAAGAAAHDSVTRGIRQSVTWTPGPVLALQPRDQPQPASAATGPAATNGAARGPHVIASELQPAGPSPFPRPSAGPAGSGPLALARSAPPPRVWVRAGRGRPSPGPAGAGCVGNFLEKSAGEIEK